jgi:two-component system chemotaxis response regulator CheB
MASVPGGRARVSSTAARIADADYRGRRDVIVVGTSAGGVEALQTLVAGLPSDLAAAVLVVMHLPAHTQSRLDEILARAGPLPARFAEDGERIGLGCVYLASPGRHLMLDGDTLRLTCGPKENRSRPAIDVLFRSAAYSYGSRVIGTVLTGMLDDGTAGLWAIKQRGGIAIVQSPSDAAHPAMPQSAITHVDVDHVVSLAELSACLTHLVANTAGAAASAPRPSSMDVETRIALDGNALQRGVMELGTTSPNTCPSCHGVLVRLTEGSIIRFRCHTGHAYSLQSLLVDVEQEIEDKLWSAMRAIEERALLLEQMASIARECGDADGAHAYDERARRSAERGQAMRELAMDVR